MIDLSTKEKKQIAVANLKSLLTHPGWMIVEDVIKENIEAVKKNILVGTDNETLEDVKRFRDDLAIHQGVLNTPQNLIKKLEDLEKIEIPNDDPYDKVEDNPKLG